MFKNIQDKFSIRHMKPNCNTYKFKLFKAFAQEAMFQNRGLSFAHKTANIINIHAEGAPGTQK